MAKITKSKTVKTEKPKTQNKKPMKKITETETLAKELKSLIPKLDEEGLAFLIKQAHTHIYNMQVDAMNESMMRDEQRTKTSAKNKKTNKIDNEYFKDINISETNSGYHMLYGTTWIAFTAKEITTMVKIVYGEGDEAEIRERLYNWLSRERSDLLKTADIINKFSDKLLSLIKLLKKNFKLKK